MKLRGLASVLLLGLLFILPYLVSEAASTPSANSWAAATTPVWSGFQPANWVSGPTITCSIRVDNQDGLIALGTYRVSTDGGVTWSGQLSDGLTVAVVGGGTSATLMVSGLSLPHSDSANQNLVRFSIRDGLGLQWWSGDYAVRVDSLSPQSAVTTAGCYSSNWPGAISGTASDSGSGVALVEVTLRRSDGRYFNGASWQTQTAWLTANGTASWTYDFTPGQDTYTVQSRATDGVGRVQSGYGQGTFRYDATRPQSSVETEGYYKGDTWPGTIVGLASDAESGVAVVEITVRRSDGRYFNGASWVTSPVWLAASGTNAWSYAFVPPLDSVYNIQSRATDSCGNVQTPPGAGSFVHDDTPPAAPTGLAASPAGWTATNSFDVAWTNPGDVSGIARAHYKWNQAPTAVNDESMGSPVDGLGIQGLVDLQVPSEGGHRLYVWLEDLAGNASHLSYAVTAPDAFRWDGTPPATSITGVSGDAGCDGWFTGDVTIGLASVDATAGVSTTFYRVDGGSWQAAVSGSLVVSGEGAHTVEYYSVDVVGNQEPIKILTPPVKIDGTTPATSQPSYTGTRGGGDWYVTPVRVVLNAFDATAGISVTYHKINEDPFAAGDRFDLTEDGVHTLQYYSVDAACNSEAVQTASTSVKIDQTPPTTAANAYGEQQNGWFSSSPVTVSLSSTDLVDSVETSGIDRVRYKIGTASWQQWTGSAVTFTVSLPPGQDEWEQVVQYYGVDGAGNEESVKSLTIGIDRQAPDPIRVMPLVSPTNWTKANCFTVTWNTAANPYDLSGIGGAYYSFDVPIAPDDGTLVTGAGITSIPCVQVPQALGDGAHNLFVWLQDGAGNSDHDTRRVVTLRLDRTPPLVTASVDGAMCGSAGWYNSCVTVTGTALDTLSGMATGVISYQVNTGPWIAGSSYTECTDGIAQVRVRAADGAGNVSAVATTPMIKIDRSPPNAPMDVQVKPDSWTNTPVFELSWLNPGELSGLAGVLYKVGSAPTSSADGTYVDGVRSSVAVTATAEGAIPVYLWLRDKACNSDYRNRAAPTVRFDATPPTTTFSLSGDLGGGGWYLGPVQVTLQGEDAASGWAGSRFRVSGQPWSTGTAFQINSDGVMTFTYYSLDGAGNVESAKVGTVKVDRQPPQSYAHSSGYSPTSSFTVHWAGSDDLSGVLRFDVQYRIGLGGSWQDWVLGADSLESSRLFVGATPGKVYYFRSRAQDVAGNMEPYPETPDTFVSVDPVQNGDFERALGSEWSRSWTPGGSGQPRQCIPARAIVPAETGGNTYAVVLGCPDESGAEEGAVPFGTSRVCQALNVPAGSDMPAPVLSFRYHVLTYDVLWSERYQRFYDSFHVTIGPTAVFTDGNRSQDYGQLVDLGWRQGELYLGSYAGQTIEVCLANVTRVDTLFNTWAYVDDVRLVNLEHRVHLPVVKRRALLPAQVLTASSASGQTSNNGLR